MKQSIQSIKTCVVVGGGIGGLSCARALRRAGVATTVLEQAPTFSPTAGAGFGFSINGQACLHELEVLDPSESIGHPFQRHIVYDRHFRKPLVNSDYLGRLQQKYGYSIAGTLRADLVERLREALEREDALKYNSKVVRVEEGSPTEPAKVTTEEGTEYEADLVVGADGIRSEILRNVIGEKHTPVFSGECIFYGVINDMEPLPKSDIGKYHHVVQSYGKHGEFISFRCGPQGETFVWAQTYRPSVPPPNVDEWSSGENPLEELELCLEEWKIPVDHPLRELAKRSSPERLLHFPLCYRQTEDEWFRNRVCLLGDACHATLPYAGQGANMAIEDSVVLAQELAAHSQLEDALQAYFNKRFKRTKTVVDMARTIGKLTHVSWDIQLFLLEKALSRVLQSEAVLGRIVQEIVEHCPVPVKDLDPELKLVK